MTDHRVNASAQSRIFEGVVGSCFGVKEIVMRLLTGFSALLAAAMISGCASVVYEGRFPWDAGWRQGTVIVVGERELAQRLARQCRGFPPMATSTRFATIRWSEMNRPKWTTVAILEKSVPKVGDMVYVNVRDCHASLESRATAAPFDGSLGL